MSARPTHRSRARTPPTKDEPGLAVPSAAGVKPSSQIEEVLSVLRIVGEQEPATHRGHVNARTGLTDRAELALRDLQRLAIVKTPRALVRALVVLRLDLPRHDHLVAVRGDARRRDLRR